MPWRFVRPDRVSVNRNLAANFLGTTWAALVQIAFIPLYIKYIGMEAYGLLATYASLQALLSLLDAGLTANLTREMARFKAGALQTNRARTLLRSVEFVFLGLGLAVFCAVSGGAPWLAGDWLKVEALPIPTVIQALCLMGGIIALRWFAGLYRGVITGLQHLVWLNAANAVFATVRGAGVVLVLQWISPTIEAFFLYQTGVTVVEVAVLFRKSWRLLPSPDRPSFSPVALRGIWRFSAGLTMISLLVMFMMQTDKLLLSKMLSLRDFGYYALAGSVAGSMNFLIGPVSGVAYPRLSELVARGDRPALSEAYHRFSQMVTLAIVPSALILALFPENLLMLWIQDAETVGAVAPLVTPLAIGFMLNGFMNTPYNLLLAHGRTKFIIKLYGVLVLLFLPAVYWGVSRYGAVAAAYAWVAINASCFIFAAPLVHKNLMPQGKWRWYRQDVALPAAAAFAGGFVVCLSTPRPVIHENWMNLLVVSSAFLIAFFAASFACPLGREMAARAWSLRSKMNIS